MANAVPQTFVTVYEMVAVPEASPETTPAEDTVAMAGEPLLQVPPVPVVVNVVVAPTHNVPVPDTAPAVGKV